MKETPLILIVEDEHILAMDLEELFAEEGYRTAVAASAVEVEAVFLTQMPDAALVDMQLRDGLSGPRIARRLHGRGVPVLVHSGQRTDLEGLPVAARLTKPAPHAVLLAEVRRVLGNKSG